MFNGLQRIKEGTALATQLLGVFLCLGILAGSFSWPTPARGETFNVLIVGNSYAAGTKNYFSGFFSGDPANSVSLTSITPGGQNLIGHFATQSTLDTIAAGDWDFIILQDQSLTPSYAYMSFMNYFNSGGLMSFTEYADYWTRPEDGNCTYNIECFWAGGTYLSQYIIDNSTAQIVYFSSWARHPEVTGILSNFPPPGDPEAQAATMLSYNNNSYEALQVRFSSRSQVAYVGSGWAASYAYDPALRLHGGDGSHGSSAGYYMAGAILYESVTGASSVGNSYTGGLSSQDAASLQALAHGDTPAEPVTGAGAFTAEFSGTNSLWDVGSQDYGSSGQLCATDSKLGDVCVDVTTTTPAIVDSKGRISGTASVAMTATLNGELVVDAFVAGPLKGKLKGKDGVTQFDMKFKGKNLVTPVGPLAGEPVKFSASSVTKGVVDSAGNFTSNATVKPCVKGIKCMEVQMDTLQANLGDGSWTIALDVDVDDRGKLTGTATADTALGSIDYTIKGSFKDKTGESKLKLTPVPGQEGSKIDIKALRPAQLDETPGATVKYKIDGYQGTAIQFFELN